MEDFKTAKTDDVKSDIFNSFCEKIWTVNNRRRIIHKSISFKVREDLMSTDIGQVFNAWSDIDYVSYKASTNEFDYASLIRQKANNIYTHLFDKRVCLKKEYLDLLKTPKVLYFRWCNGEIFTAASLTDDIDNAINSAIEIKELSAIQKSDMEWNTYKRLCNGFFRKMFENCMLLTEYEDENMMCSDTGLFNEDNFYISYFCKSLDGYFRNHQKEMAGIKRKGRKKTSEYIKKCKLCGKLITFKGNKKMYCDECRKLKNRENGRIRQKRYRTTNVTK